MENKSEGQILYDHYKETKRTPLSVPFKYSTITELQFQKFILLLEETPDIEKIEVINDGITTIEIHRDYISKMELSGDEIKSLKKSYRKMLLTLNQLLTTPKSFKKKFPPLPDCFKEKKDWEIIINSIQLNDYFEPLENNTYKWKGNKNELAGLAHRNMNLGKLIDSIKTNQDLAKVFCSYFAVEFNPKEEKSFQPDRAKIYLFDWIN
jgi:hypothetical protein